MSIEWLTSKPRHWPRYGDGNWLVMGRAQGPNCDGHRMDLEGMADEMLETVKKPKEGIDYALTSFARARCPGLIATYASNAIQWTDGDILIEALKKGAMGELSLFLAEHRDRLCYVAPPHFQELPREIYGNYHLEMRKNCWKDTGPVVDMLADMANRFDVVVFAASFLTSCAIYRLHEIYEGKWLLDVGSTLDPLCGIFSREYHRPVKRKDGKSWPEVYGFKETHTNSG